MANEKNTPLKIVDTVVQPGERITLALPTPELYTCSPTYIPIHVFHGKYAGPRLLVCAGTHGDELNGVAMIQRVLELSLLKRLQGTLIAVPVINVHGLITQSSGLPDKRDLEESFPGASAGSFAARLAHLFSESVISLATHCIDIHTGDFNNHRFPQVHTNIEMPEALRLAESFQSPIIHHTLSKRGLLWKLYDDASIPVVAFEGGEAFRLDEMTIKSGIRGIVRVMRELKMIEPPKRAGKTLKPLIVRSSHWLRSTGSGICKLHKQNGSSFKRGELLAEVIDPFGTGRKNKIFAEENGVVIGSNFLPLVNEGDALLEVAKPEKSEEPLSEWKGSEIIENL